MDKKVIVIGGGPAGYAAAIKAAQLGAGVILAEKHKIGGTCLNYGCVPAKTLLRTAEFFKNAVSNAVPGVIADNVSLDWSAAQKHKEQVINQLSNGVAALLKRSGVTVCNEKALLPAPSQVRIGNETLHADAVILASGSVNSPLSLPGNSVKSERVIDSSAALAMERIPESVIIIGGGVIGVEFAVMLMRLGVKTAVIEQAPQLLPSADEEVAAYLKMTLESEGAAVYTGAKVIQAVQNKSSVTVTVKSDKGTVAIEAGAMLTAVGRSPNTAGLGLEETGIQLVRGAFVTDDYFQTNVHGVYAVGDCNGKAMLAHAAIAQGEAAAEHIMGVAAHINNKLVPACIFSSPEIAYVGRTEQQLRADGIKYNVGRFDLAGNARSIIESTGGFVKVLADSKFGEVLGVHIAGPHASEMIAEAAVCMNMEGTVEDIVNTIHAHPTVSEATREAAMSVFGRPIHG